MLINTLVLAAICLVTPAQSGDWRGKVGPDGAPSEIEPIHAPFEMPQLARPMFPDRIVDIADFGAVGDGKTKNTEAIADAIEACSRAGGGTVRIPAGTWLTGAIHLKSNINLHLGENANLRFSDDPEDYLPVVFTRWAGFECYNYSPLIYAVDCDNIGITGPGAIDGNGRPWWPWEERQSDTATRMYEEQILKGVPADQRVYGTPQHGLRPQLISPVRCTNVLLEGFTIAEAGPFWTIDLVYCDRVIARCLRILTEGGPNTDGLNVDSSTNVLIEHCYFDTGDDCICMKSGMNEDGWRVGRPTENVVVRNNRTARGHGGIVFGSDTSGGIRNIYTHSCLFEGTDIGIRLKSTRGRGGVVEHVWCERIDMTGVRREAFQMTTAYRAWMGTTEGKAPIFRHLTLRDITVTGAAHAARLEGLPEAPIEDVRLRNVRFETREGFSADRLAGLSLGGVVVEAEEGPDVRWRNCQRFVMDGTSLPSNGER
ncbi:MAG: glycoside hydrolase family 28 protein [bacterium]|nr:glycoside hydrolase family 28 protein [bacterium]